MKKLFMLLCAGLLALAMFGTALADVEVATDVTKTWTATITTTAAIDKAIYLGVKQLAPVDSSAQADVTKNDENYCNIVLELPSQVAPLTMPDEMVLPTATLTNEAFQDATGVISVNQAPGDANNQGNAVAIAYANDDSAFLNASAHVEKELGCLEEVDTATPLDAGIGGWLMTEYEGWSTNPFSGITCANLLVSVAVTRLDEITETAFMNVTGVVGVNQAAGNINNQDNAMAAAIGGDPTASLAESDLGLVLAENCVIEVDVDKTDTVDASAFSAAAGILSLNQSSGNCNNQANSVAVVVASFEGPF